MVAASVGVVDLAIACMLHATDRVPQRAMSLTKQQRQDMMQLRRLFLNKLLGIVQRRAEINTELATALPHGTETRDAAMEYLRAHKSIDELKNNLKDEHILVQDFLSTLLRHVRDGTFVMVEMLPLKQHAKSPWPRTSLSTPMCVRVTKS